MPCCIVRLPEIPKPLCQLRRFIATIGAAFLLTCGCQRNSALSSPDPGAGRASTPASAANSLELSDEQRAALKIEPVHTASFTVESEAIGTISFDEDPAIVQAESNLVSAAASLEMSRRELVRVQSLGESNGIAPKEVESDIAARQTAAAALKATRDTVRALGKTDAEIDHIIAAGDFASNPANRRTRWVVVNVPESDSPRIRVGQRIRVTVPAYPDHWYSGRISRIYATIDPNTHRLTVRAQVDDPAHELRAGMLADIVIRVVDPVESIALPSTAMVRKGDGSMIIWTTTDRRRFTERRVTLGLESAGRYQVLAGLAIHELAVTEGGVFLSNMLEAPPDD